MKKIILQNKLGGESDKNKGELYSVQIQYKIEICVYCEIFWQEIYFIKLLYETPRKDSHLSVLSI